MLFSTQISPDIFYLSFVILVTFSESSFQTSPSLLDDKSQIKTPSYLPEAKFNYNEYSEYSDNDDREKGGPRAPSPWSQLPNAQIFRNRISGSAAPTTDEELDAGITWDPKWPSSEIKFGQLSAVSLDPEGNVVVFHRGSRVWGTGSFDMNNKFDREEGPVRENTLIKIGADGKKISEWGRSLFYLPHGLTIDHLGNYWITDVAMHQVFKFDAKDVEEELKNFDKNSKTPSAVKPALVLGEAFEPGNDNKRFCKPTAVAVQKNGDFFVSDGYCNSRIIKFNKLGERILTWGRTWGTNENLFSRPPPVNALYVPHSLALDEELDYVFVADRENGRILCFHSNNGTFHKEYKNSVIGSRIFGVAYAKNKIYVINGPEFGPGPVRVRGFVVDINSGNVQAQFAPPTDLKNPHDLAVSSDGRSIYVVELNPYKVHKFIQEPNSSVLFNNQNHATKIADVASVTDQSLLPHEESVLNSLESSLKKDKNEGGGTGYGSKIGSEGFTATTIILSLVTAAVLLVVSCVAVAAIVARCRKRGCLLLTVRRGMRWESERRENYKLSNLLESRKIKKGKGRKFFDKRPNTRDFSKLNTEPETSDDDNNLTKII